MLPRTTCQGWRSEAATSSTQDGQLLPQGQILQEQISTRTKGSGSKYEQEPQKAEHSASLTRKNRRNRR